MVAFGVQMFLSYLLNTEKVSVGQNIGMLSVLVLKYMSFVSTQLHSL